MADLTILHTSDLHNQLTVEMSESLCHIRESLGVDLMLDSGDAIWAGNIFWWPWGEPILRRMLAAGYDAMCLGNREFHLSSIGLRSKLSKAVFPVVCANIRPRIHGGNLAVEPYDVFSVLGGNIAVFGLTVPCVTRQMFVSNVASFHFIDPVEAAAELVPELRENSDFVVALTHIGIEEDRRLAESVDGIDLILGGHSHPVTNEPFSVNGTLVAHHGSGGRYAGLITVHGDQISHELVEIGSGNV
jgi:2',3'-cyclic-nucleotide 2'-phosphodiesterase (5'-nucleotidase family)